VFGDFTTQFFSAVLYFLTPDTSHPPFENGRRFITVLEQLLRAEQVSVSEILRLFLVREIFPFPPIRRFQICLHINPPIGGDGDCCGYS
jgi:hypothetical protein